VLGFHPNAVKTQIWIAVTTYLIVANLHKQMKLPATLNRTLDTCIRTILVIVKTSNQVHPLPEDAAQFVRGLLLLPAAGATGVTSAVARLDWKEGLKRTGHLGLHGPL